MITKAASKATGINVTANFAMELFMTFPFLIQRSITPAAMARRIWRRLRCQDNGWCAQYVDIPEVKVTEATRRISGMTATASFRQKVSIQCLPAAFNLDSPNVLQGACHGG